MEKYKMIFFVCGVKRRVKAMTHKTCLLACKTSKILHNGIKEISDILEISSSDFQRAAVYLLASMYHDTAVSKELLRDEIIRCNLSDFYFSAIGGTAGKLKSALRERLENRLSS